MKVAPIIFLVLLALTASGARTIESICRQGPSVYCETEEKAQLCRKLEFCTEWQRIRSQPKIVRMRPSEPDDIPAVQPFWWG